MPEDICIEVSALADNKNALQEWQEFLRVVSNIFTTVRDINMYTDEIRKESSAISNIMLQQMK